MSIELPGAGSLVETVDGAGGAQRQVVAVAAMPAVALDAAALAALAAAATPGTQPVSGPLTDAQLRASPLEVIAATGGLTNAQLRADPVAMTAAALPLPAGAATEATIAAVNAKMPTIGQKAAAASVSVTLASDQGLLSTNPLGQAGVARKLTANIAGGASNSVPLTAAVRRISIVATSTAMRFVYGTGAQTATANSHFIQASERLEFNVPANAVIAVISDTTTAGVLEITELL